MIPDSRELKKCNAITIVIPLLFSHQSSAAVDHGKKQRHVIVSKAIASR